MRSGELSAYLTGGTTNRGGSPEALAAGLRRQNTRAIADQMAMMLASISSVWQLSATQAAAVRGTLPSGLDAYGVSDRAAGRDWTAHNCHCFLSQRSFDLSSCRFGRIERRHRG